MKILLINPPNENNTSPPLGLAYLASVLIDNNNNVDIVDMAVTNMSLKELREIIKSKLPEIVGITATTPVFYYAIKISKMIKNFNKNIFVVIGGAHASAVKREILDKYDSFDAVVYSEGELTIVELIDRLKNNKSLRGVAGCICRENGKIITNESRALISNLDDLPFPKREVFQMDLYSIPITILTSRGCPYNCIFCFKGVWGYKWRPRSLENIIKEIEMLRKKYGIKRLGMVDDLVTLDKRRIKKLCDEFIKRNYKFKWAIDQGARIDSVDKDLLIKMKKAGCYRIAYGVESGNEKILENIGKKINLNQVRETVKATKEVGIKTAGLFMIGNPGENPETVKDSIRFAKECKFDEVRFHMATPYPGTRLWKYIEENGRFLVEIGDYYNFSSHRETTTFETDDFTAEERNRVFAFAEKEIYRHVYLLRILSPVHILKRLLSIKDMKDIGFIFRRVIDVVKNSV